MRNYVWVAVGSGMGGLVRYLASMFSVVLFGTEFPFGTLAVNIAGSVLIGWFAAFARAESGYFMGREQRLLLMVGFCGGLTTFSFFSWQTLHLLHTGRIPAMALYVLSSVILSLVGVWGSYILTVRRTAKK